jgi:hypothetical protein
MKRRAVTVLAGLVVFVVLTLGATGVVGVLSGRAAAQAVAQSFTAETSLQPGMVVELGNDKDNIKPVTQNEASKMLGVVVQPNDAPLSLTTTNAGQKAYVATTGTYRMLASDQNGAIKRGDYLIVSSLDGIAMKVNDSTQYVVGKALSGFDGSSGVLTQTTAKDTHGQEHVIKVGYVGVSINISRNPLLKNNNPESNLPGFLLKVTDSVANKQVSAVRAYISLALAVLTAIIVCTVLYAGIRNSIIALGRNPLARKSIIRNLLQVIITSLIILFCGFFAVYLLLKL